MQTIVNKVRDQLNDNYIIQKDLFTYDGVVNIFPLTSSNLDEVTIKVYKNGLLWSSTPITGTGVAWTRVGTVITISKSAHGLITGDSINITVTSNPAALPLATYTVTTLTNNTFTIVGLNAGLTSGTCTYIGITNYIYESSSATITIIGTIISGDSILVEYNSYNKYSDNELKGFIRASLVHLSVENYKTFKADGEIIFPTPTEFEENLISLIATILIKGDVVSYRSPEISVTFERGDNQDKKIKKAIRQFSKAFGTTRYIDLKKQTVDEE